MLAPRPTPKLEDHPSSAVRGCLFNLFTATLNIGRRSSIRNPRTRHAVVKGTHIHGDEVTGEWRKLNNEELNDLYSLSNIVRVVKWRRMRWAGHVARMGEDRGVHRVLVGKPGGKRPLGRPRRRWEDNIKMDLQEVGGGRGDWMKLAQYRDGWRALVGTVRNFRVP